MEWSAPYVEWSAPYMKTRGLFGLLNSVIEFAAALGCPGRGRWREARRRSASVRSRPAGKSRGEGGPHPFVQKVGGDVVFRRKAEMRQLALRAGGVA